MPEAQSFQFFRKHTVTGGHRGCIFQAFKKQVFTQHRLCWRCGPANSRHRFADDLFLLSGRLFRKVGGALGASGYQRHWRGHELPVHSAKPAYNGSPPWPRRDLLNRIRTFLLVRVVIPAGCVARANVCWRRDRHPDGCHLSTGFLGTSDPPARALIHRTCFRWTISAVSLRL